MLTKLMFQVNHSINIHKIKDNERSFHTFSRRNHTDLAPQIALFWVIMYQFYSTKLVRRHKALNISELVLIGINVRREFFTTLDHGFQSSIQATIFLLIYIIPSSQLLSICETFTIYVIYLTCLNCWLCSNTVDTGLTLSSSAEVIIVC